MDTQQLYRLDIMAYGVTDPLALAEINERRLELLTDGESPLYLVDEMEEAYRNLSDAEAEVTRLERDLCEAEGTIESLENELDDIRRYGCSSCESSA